MWWASVLSACCGISLASSATRWSFVEMFPELELSAICPSRDSVPRCPLPSTGSPRVRVSLLRRYYEAFRLPSAHRAALRSSLARRFPPLVEAHGSPRFLESPDARMPGSQTPVGPRPQVRCGVEVLPSVSRTTSAPTKCHFRGSMTQPAHSLCTLHARGYPRPAQHSVLAVDLLCQTGLATRWALMKGF